MLRFQMSRQVRTTCVWERSGRDPHRPLRLLSSESLRLPLSPASKFPVCDVPEGPGAHFRSRRSDIACLVPHLRLRSPSRHRCSTKNSHLRMLSSNLVTTLDDEKLAYVRPLEGSFATERRQTMKYRKLGNTGLIVSEVALGSIGKWQD